MKLKTEKPVKKEDLKPWDSDHSYEKQEIGHNSEDSEDV